MIYMRQRFSVQICKVKLEICSKDSHFEGVYSCSDSYFWYVEICGFDLSYFIQILSCKMKSIVA